MIIHSISEFKKMFGSLKKGDAFVGNLVFRPGEEFKAIDLLNRGVIVFPSIQAQFLSRSKVFQAEILDGFMLKDTFVAYKNRDIIQHLPAYARHGEVICKRDRKHLGLGLSKWRSLEDLESLAAMETLPYPFVVQPFLRDARDIRLLIIDDYCEAYEKTNPYSFRKNLAYGGKASKIEIPPGLENFCRKIMARGDFPYAIIDVLVDKNSNYHLSEISMSGGLTGSSMGQEEFIKRKKHILRAFCRKLDPGNNFAMPANQSSRK
jgi:ribosomal protein S6--L-glutamate ligase